MHKKATIIILLLTFVVFGNALFNHFVGDDSFLFLNNSFYRSWDNIARIFNLDYISMPDQILNANTSLQDLNSGAVSYRPVLSLTYFLDYHLWELNAFGYHLQSLLWHFGNSVLVYFLAFIILKRADLSLLSAIIFCIHPLKSEPVCAIGYRADMLASFFALAAFLCYAHRSGGGAVRRTALFFLSHFLFLVALLAKESVIIFPILLIAFDELILGRPVNLQMVVRRYLGFFLIDVVYIYLYIAIFPNSSLGNTHLIGGSILTHLLGILTIFFNYLLSFTFPFTVKILPPVFTPLIDYRAGLGAILVLGIVYILARAWRSSKIFTFSLMWFLLAFTPISNVVPIINPMAYRFMYFPSVGLSIIMALLINQITLRINYDRVQSGKIITIGYIGLCMGMTMALNPAWKNNFVMASNMISDNPSVPTGYLFLGGEYFDRGLFSKAEDILEEGV